ncbi:MAG: Fe-S-containing protein [bacterium]|nr:Fe-S-containing protein [bacterium]
MKIKRNFIISIIIVAVAVAMAGYFLFAKPGEQGKQGGNASSICAIKEITFYYLDGCEWCNKVKSEGTLEKIEGLGIKINKINASVGPVRYKFTGVPTFIINEKVYEGYRTFDEIKELLSCPVGDGYQAENQPSSTSVSLPAVQVQTEKSFFGQKGEKVVFENKEIRLEATQFNDNKARFYNVEMPDGKIVRFFVIKDKKGVYRAAADACQVCFGERKGFRQEGDEIVCNNCGNRYPIEKIATEKGGCNPGPINPNLQLQDGKIIIEQADIEQVSNLF